MHLNGLWRVGAALCLLVGSTWIPATAQQHAFRQVSPEDGLAQSQVRCMAQDAEGYLWFGTIGGASRFDGHAFTNYGLQEGLPDAHVSAMALDSEGVLWLGSGSNLVRRVGDRLVAEPLPSGGLGARIMAMTADDQGRVFAATDGDGLFVRDDKGIRAFEGFPLDTAGSVRSVLALSDGRLLIGLRTGLLIWENGHFARVALDDAGPKAISAIAEGRDGSWWVGTVDDGLFHISRDGRRTTYDIESDLIRNNVRCLLVDDRGRLWVGTKFGLNLFEDGRMRLFTIHQGMPNDNILCAYQDHEGNIWFGTDGAGALRYLTDRFVTFTVKDGLCSDLIMNVTADASGDLWLGTYDNGVCRMDGMAFVNTLDGLPNNTVWCGSVDGAGRMWFGTSDGVARIARGLVEPLPAGNDLFGQRVLSMHQDGRGRLWCGTRDGLSMMSGEGPVQHFPISTNGPGRSVRSIVEDGKGHLWMASDMGITRFDGKGFKTFTSSDGLSDNIVQCLLYDGRGRLWAGTTNGLSCYDGEGFTTRRFADDFGSNFISLLIGDDAGRIWAGTNNGLFLFYPDSLLSDPGSHWHITLDDGLRSLEFNLNAAYRDPRGRLLLGSSAGLVFHDVERHLDSPLPPVPRVLITGVRSFLQETDWRGRSTGMDEHGLPIGLELDPGRNHLTFDYAAIGFSYPDRVLYRYRLLGSEEDWLPATDARFASFGNLGHGTYTFEVIASRNDGRWSAAEQFSFTIHPPFWMRWWFFLLCGVSLFASLWGVQRYRAVRRARHERTRQLMLRSRMLQLEQQALNANMNRHFVFNALNSIQYHINKQDRATASRYLTSFAKLIRKNLDASQNDTTTLAEELERLELYLVLEHMRFKDRFRYSIDVCPGVDTGQVRLPAMMLQPYVENSIWHGILPMKEPGVVSIIVEPIENGRVVVRIEDNGIGVDHSRETKQERESDHISRGIEITKGRADVLRKLELTDIRINGPEQWYTEPGGSIQGTRVRIELPNDATQKNAPALAKRG